MIKVKQIIEKIPVEYGGETFPAVVVSAVLDDDDKMTELTFGCNSLSEKLIDSGTGEARNPECAYTDNAIYAYLPDRYLESGITDDEIAAYINRNYD